MSLDTPRLTLRPCSPEHLVVLIDEPARFEEVSGLRAADGLRSFFVSDEVSPDWLAALRGTAGPDPWRHGFFVVVDPVDGPVWRWERDAGRRR